MTISRTGASALIVAVLGLAACGGDPTLPVSTEPAKPAKHEATVPTGPAAPTGETAPAPTEPGDAPEPADRSDPTGVALAHVEETLGFEPDEEQIFKYPSKKDKEWYLVTGFGTKGDSFSVWLQSGPDGWTVVEAIERGGKGPKGVPCDIDYSFSEPSC
jgi:hypothetical protein